LIEDAGVQGLPQTALTTRVGVDPRDVSRRIDELVAAGDAIAAGDVLVAPSVMATLKKAIAGALTEHHRAQPLSEGIPRETLREQLFGRGHAAVFDRALAELTSTGVISVRDRVALATHRMALAPDEQRARTAIEQSYREAGLKPPDLGTVAAQTATAAAVADRMLKLLQRQKVLVRVDTLVFHDEALKRLKADVGAMKASGVATTIDVATFKERFGVSRKFAIPLLEYLDRERVTRRVGESRVIL
jgi:selenocysteine-specific elongation factor